MTSNIEIQECILTICATEKDVVHIFCDYPKWMNKLERAGAVITKVHPSGGKEYTLDVRQLSIRKKRTAKEMSEEQRQQARERLKRMRETRI